jgi:hypothetical protein
MALQFSKPIEESPMAEQEKIEKQKTTVKNVGKASYVFTDADGVAKHVGPGQEVELELRKQEVERMKKVAEAGGGTLVVDGTDPRKKAEENDKVEGAPEPPKEHSARNTVAEKETELMQAGQEAGKEQREKWAKKDWNKLAAETGIGIMARGGVDALETVAAAPDAPPKEK